MPNGNWKECYIKFQKLLKMKTEENIKKDRCHCIFPKNVHPWTIICRLTKSKKSKRSYIMQILYMTMAYLFGKTIAKIP